MNPHELALRNASALALSELPYTTIEAVQRSTAYTWGGRALAAFQLFHTSGVVQWLHDGEEYMHEALEHAALDPDPAVIDAIRPFLQEAAEAARVALRTACPQLR